MVVKDNENILGARRCSYLPWIRIDPNLPWIRIDPTAYGCWIVEIAPLIVLVFYLSIMKGD